MTFVMIACFTIILYFTCKICLDKFLDITAATADDLDTLCLKNILSTLTDIAGKHDHHTHLSQDWSDSALASATLR